MVDAAGVAIETIVVSKFVLASVIGEAPVTIEAVGTVPGQVW